MGKPKKAVVKIDVETGEVLAIYDSVGSASRASYVSETAIRNTLYRRTKNPLTYKWEFLEEYKKEHDISGIEVIKSHHKNEAIPVIYYDFAGNKLGEYSSMNEASRETGISIGKISLICRGKLKKDCYMWRYAEEEEQF